MLPNPMQTPPIGGMAPMNTTPPMNAMPPMPPMGKMPNMEMNLDPMARQNFNNMMSGIQSQAMTPPMPMHMNEGGSVNPIMALLQGIGQLFGFDGGQKQGGSGTLDDFNSAFAAARRAGKKTFSFDRDRDGVPELYTTLFEGETEGESGQPEVPTQGSNEEVKPSNDELFDMLIKRKGSSERKGESVQDLLRQAEGSVPESFDERIKGLEEDKIFPLINQQIEAMNDLPNNDFISTSERKHPLVLHRSQEGSFSIPALIASSTKKTTGRTRYPDSGVSINEAFALPDFPAIRENNLRSVLDPNPPSPPTLKDIGDLRDPETGLSQILPGLVNDTPGNSIEGLLDALLNGGASVATIDDIKSKFNALGMNQGGSVTDAIAKLNEGGPPEEAKDNETLQYLKDFFSRGISDGDRPEEDALKIMGGVGLQSLLAMPVIQSLMKPKGKLNKMFFNPEFDFKGRDLHDEAFKKYGNKMGFTDKKGQFTKYVKPTQSFPDFYKNLPESEKYLDKGKIVKNTLGRGLGQLLKKGVPLASLLTPNMAGDGSLPESMIVNKNQGGVIPVQGYDKGGNVINDFFNSVKEQFDESIPKYDSNKYDSASEQAKAENIAAGNAMDLSPGSFIGAEKYTYPVGDRLLTFAAGNNFGQDKDPDPIVGTPGGAKPNIAGMTSEEAQAYIKSMAPTTYGTTGDYSDLDTFKNYTFGDPNFQFDDFMQAGEIAGYGQANKLASDINKLSGASEGSYFQEGEDVVDDSVVGGTANNVADTNMGSAMTSTASTPISPFAKIEQATVVPSTRTVDSTFTPLASADIYNPNFLTDLPDFSSLAIDPSQSSAIDLQKFLEMDQDKTTPKAFTPNTTSITDIMKASGYQQGGAVSPGLNMAIDKFISAYS